MATSTVAGAATMARLLLVLASLLFAVLADDPVVIALQNVPEWQRESAMSLKITDSSGVIVPFTYTVVPLTASLGLNQSELARETVSVRGNIVVATPANFLDVKGSDKIAYLSCDVVNASYISSSDMFNVLMRNKLRAILLYSTKGSCCSLDGADLPFETIFSMTDLSEATETWNITDSADGVVQATISGNVSTAKPDEEERRSGNNSAVAMSILYSITGLITMLFLIIIATGAIRAHRYPERYGPRSALGGRPRQSRAKGIARAVLETLPIVKFGGPAPAKPDPAHELESQAPRPSQDQNMGTRLSAIPEEPQPQPQRRPSQSPATPRVSPDAQAPSAANQEAAGGSTKQEGDEHLGCSICTEDFTVGEDVRVLPCDHRFHPACIDPWLINVSGTCPLCRHDLRPDGGEAQDATTLDDFMQLPPPLEAEASGTESATSQRRRASRLLDLHRLRHASVEERIEILRSHRSQQQESATTAAPPAAEDGRESPERGSRAKLTDRLRDKFRIRTRAQSPGRSAQDGPGPSS